MASPIGIDDLNAIVVPVCDSRLLFVVEDIPEGESHHLYFAGRFDFGFASVA